MMLVSNDQRNVHLKRRIAQISVLVALAVGYFCIIIDANDNLNDSVGTRALSTREVARGVREVRREHRKRQRRLANALKDEVAATKEELDEWAKQQQQLDEWAKVLKDADEELAEVENVQVATTPKKKNLSFSEKLEEAQKMLEEYAMAYPAESVDQQSDNVPLFEPAQDILQSEWCTAPTEPPIPYDKCRWDSMVMRFGVYGGLTNALHFILKGAIWAMEEDVCFFVSELHGKHGVSKLAHREAPEETVTPFLERYFEPIGIPEDHERVIKAQKWNEIFEPHYHQIQYHEYGRRSAGIAEHGSPYRSKHLTRDLDFLNLWDVDNVWLKKHVMRRLLRILPERREESCSRLKDHGLDGKYIALSVRRGDKVLEYELESSMKPYIDAVEEATQTHFDGTVPTIFVASDDCSVMQELREMKPEWNFVSECDKMDSHGFVISEMKHWTLQETDDHYNKFLTELIAMASATYFIGVKTTNVSLFVYFMRHYDQGDDSWKFVDAPNEFVF